MKTCFIFGSLEIQEKSVRIESDDIVIAADGGLKNTQNLNITPDYIVGDFDSLEYTPEGNNVIKHPVKKDETDTILAVNIGFENGFKNFVIYGCLGGRLDQTVASIQTANYIAEKGGNAVFVDTKTHLTVLKNNSITFSEANCGVISVLAVSGDATEVNIQGLLYEVENGSLTSDYPLGVSNEFVGKESKISVKKGKICVIWDGETGTYTLNGGNYDN